MNLENINVQEMNTEEMKNTDGGFLILLAIGACLLLGGCAATRPVAEYKPR